jgi:hypothetical protein
LIANPRQKNQILGSVAGTLAEAGNVEGVLYVINLIEDQESKNGQLYTVAEFLVEFGHADRAFAFLNLIEASESKNFLLAVLLSILCGLQILTDRLHLSHIPRVARVSGDFLKINK